MLESTKHRLRGIAIKKRLREIAGLEGDALTAEIRSEADGLQTELADVETREAAAIASEPDPEVRVTDTTDPEVRERLELRSKASLGGFLLAALQGRMPAGAEHEYAAAFDAKPGHVPMDLWEADRPAEERAATPAPGTGTGVSVAPVQPFVFAPSIAPRLGIDMPSVGSGGYAEMTITTALPAAPKAKGGDADDTAGELTAVVANPRRISARMSVTVEDVAAIGVGNFEAALRQNVSMALSDEYDDQVINGNGTAPSIMGLVSQLDNPTDPTAVATFDGFLRAFSDQLDGLWASTMREISLVTNPAAYKLSARTFRDSAGANPNDLGDTSFADYAMERTGGWWCNKRMPATASTLARAIVYRMGRTGLRTACHPTWGTISITDPYTSSRSGTRHFTVHALVGDKVLLVQPDAYGLAEFKVA